MSPALPAPLLHSLAQGWRPGRAEALRGPAALTPGQPRSPPTPHSQPGHWMQRQQAAVPTAEPLPQETPVLACGLGWPAVRNVRGDKVIRGLGARAPES